MRTDLLFAEYLWFTTRSRQHGRYTIRAIFLGDKALDAVDFEIKREGKNFTVAWSHQLGDLIAEQKNLISQILETDTPQAGDSFEALYRLQGFLAELDFIAVDICCRMAIGPNGFKV